MAHPDNVDAIARVAHEAARAWSLANGRVAPPAWDHADETHRHDAREGVRSCLRTFDRGEEGEDAALSVHDRLLLAVTFALAI